MVNEIDLTAPPLRLGWISYWNLLPLETELSRIKYGTIEKLSGHPTQVNQWLLDGKVNLAPCSSVNLINSTRTEIAAPIGVASNGPVKSVYLGFSREHEDLFDHIKERQGILRDIIRSAKSRFGTDCRKISSHIWNSAMDLPAPPITFAPQVKFTNASATSVALSKILYKLWFGQDAYELNCLRTSSSSTRTPVELVIGDKALVRKNSFYKTYDLGLAWKELTGLPFVFAVWQCLSTTSINGWRRPILEAAELAETKMKVEPSQYIPSMRPVDELGKQISLESYWECINYRLGPNEFKALLIFLNLTRDLKPKAMKKEDNLVKLMRWQELGQSGSLLN